ncbi:hypothetical protein [uncultured Streptomyces sp.]|uniref:hypothetical protein n=1 Tax=uncultured Streptomyces sp. TaxID=174707 RepID=UPI00261E08AC|nr:hypothetical protein [uncultured Streptomyces sp.]
MAVSRAARVAVWVVAVVAGMVSAGLVVALVVDPDMADRTASVTGAVVGLAAFVLAVVTLVRSPGTSGGGRRVRGGRGGIAAGGNITGNAIGDRSRVIGPPTTAGPGSAGGQDADVRTGRDGIAAGGDVTDNALGDDSERR